MYYTASSAMIGLSALVVLFLSSAFVSAYRTSPTSTKATECPTKLCAVQSKSNGKRSSSRSSSEALYQGSKGMPSVPMRNGEQINFVAEWQAKGDHYVSYDNLLKLDNMMGSVQGKSKSDRTSLLSELSITYFARYAEASFAGQQCLSFDFDTTSEAYK